MNKRIRVLVTGVALAVAALGITGAVVATVAPSGQHEDVVVHEMEADYPTFDTVASLDKASAVVVRVTAVEVGAAYRTVPAGLPVDKLPQFKAEQAGVLQHDVTFRVERVIKGDVAAGTMLTATELGGQVGRDRWVIDAEPASDKGQQYVLFLVRFADGKYGVVGGAQGRYQVEGGALRSLDEHSRATGVGQWLHGMNAAALERDYAKLTG
jgi:hypothetical protein